MATVIFSFEIFFMTTSSTTHKIPRPNPIQEDRELQEVREVAASMGGAVKNYALYPKDHASARRYLHTLYHQLTRFLNRYETLRLDIDKGRLLYEDEIVFDGSMGDNSFATLFSRDGIQWLTFTKGIDLDELERFLDIIHTYRTNDEESEGDIITALWEGEYPHISYKPVDILSVSAPSFSLSTLRAVAAQDILPPNQNSTGTGAHEDDFGDDSSAGESVSPEGSDNATTWDEEEVEQVQVEEDGETSSSDSPVSILLTTENDLWNLTPQERDQLQSMVDEEEYGDNTDSVIETLLVSLVVQKNKKDFAAILDFLQDRYLHTLKRGDFRVSLKLLTNLRRLQEKYTSKKRWARPLIEGFFRGASRSVGLRDIEKFLTQKPRFHDDGRTEHLWAILRLLDPAILEVLGPLAGKIQDPELLREVREIIIRHTRKSPQTLAAVLDQCDESTILQLIPIVELMAETDAALILTGMALHPSVRIRKEAFRILSTRNQLDLVKLFPLIDDPDETIRQKMFFHLAKKKDRRLEALFLDYLQNRDFKLNDSRHLLTCYRTLGRVGSERSIPFLQQVLLDRKMANMIGIGNSVHKEGAAMALHALRLTEATNILRDGAKSIRPDVRFACRKAMAGKRGKIER